MNIYCWHIVHISRKRIMKTTTDMPLPASGYHSLPALSAE